jgi:DNA (cytosine-5)-methyltransferase 1
MRQLRAISLFTGAGGLDFGFEAAGFETCAAVEVDPHCCATIRHNKPWPLLERDINATTSIELLQTAGIRAGEIDLVLGGPPCQPFSKSAYWASGDTGRLDDPRAGTLTAYMRIVAELMPTVFVLENVHGITYTGKEEGFRLLAHLTETINREQGTDYRLSWQVVNAADYGVPQLRQRFFLVAHRDGRTFRFPPPTHSPPGFEQDLFVPRQVYATAWDAIGGEDLLHPTENLQVRGRWADLLPSIPEGENYLWHTNRKSGLPLFGWRRCYWSFLLKLAKDRPSWTIQAQPGPAVGPFHWENRLLSVKEMARLQTFPPTVTFKGVRSVTQKQLGNAVPSLLAEVLGRAVVHQLFDGPLVDRYSLSVEPKRPIPSPEPVQPVPERYLHLLGEHPDHPGTGKGHSAARRISDECAPHSSLRPH